MTTLVYPVGRSRGQSLRWSLRSVAASAAAAGVPARSIRIVLVGHRPDYVNHRAHGVTVVATVQGRDRFANVWTAWQRAADTLDDDGEGWWWMNDDFYFTGAWASALTSAHLGPLEAWIARIAALGNVSQWRRRAETALRSLSAAGYEPMSWETHRPMYVEPGDVYKARHFLAEAGIAPSRVAQRTVIATVAGRTGPAWPDPKVNTREGPVNRPVMSTSPTAWKGPLGRQIRAMFAQRSPWER